MQRVIVVIIHVCLISNKGLNLNESGQSDSDANFLTFGVK